VAFVLTAAEQARLIATIETMLSPLARASPADWVRDVLQSMRELVPGDSTLLARSEKGRVTHFSEDLPALATALDEIMLAERGQLHFREAEMESGLAIRRHRSMHGFTSALLDRLTGGALVKSRFYNDVAAPLGARATLGISVSGSAGEAMIGINRDRATADLCDETTIALLTIMAPAFLVGIETLHRFDSVRTTMTTALDVMADGVLVLEFASGRELYRNSALRAMLAADSGGEELLCTARRLARSLSALRPRPSASKSCADVAPLPLLELCTTSARYILRGSRLAAETFARGESTLISVECVTISLPTIAALCARFSLTRREAQVALLLARGMTDTQAASALGISEHTVRHHGERLYSKLGVHSRKALALFLLGDTRPDRCASAG